MFIKGHCRLYLHIQTTEHHWILLTTLKNAQPTSQLNNGNTYDTQIENERCFSQSKFCNYE